MIINYKTKLLPCAQNRETIRIRLIDKDTLGFCHCCHKDGELANILKINDFMKMDENMFWSFLNKTYKTTPKNHSYTVYPYCKTKNRVCIYNDKTLKQIVLDTIDYCNIRCKMCCLSTKHILPILDEINLTTEILNKIKNHNLNTIITTGIGEPFIIKNELFNYIKSIDINTTKNIIIVSNLTLLNKDDILLLNELNKKIKIKIIASCSAITPETYRIVHCNDNFYKVVENIKLLNQYNLLDFVNFVAQESNLHELDMFKDFWINQNISYEKLEISPVHGSQNKDITKTEEFIRNVR